MNELIQKLYEQAHVSKETQVRKGGWDNDREPFEFRTVVETAFDPEKFAELIVKECAELMYGRDENGNCKDGDVIKEHFGVGE